MADAAAAGRLSVVQGDITALAVDALVNAANERMLGGTLAAEHGCRSVALPAISCGVSPGRSRGDRSQVLSAGGAPVSASFPAGYAGGAVP